MSARQTDAVRAVLLIGPPGSGKTTTLTALTGALQADDVPHAAIEVEALALVHPWPDDGVALEHLDLLTRSFERRGHPLLLVSATVADDTSLARLRACLPEDLLVVRLTAHTEVLRRRITMREPPEWVGLPRLLEATGKLSTLSARQQGVDLDLATDAVSVDGAVAAIRTRLD